MYQIDVVIVVVMALRSVKRAVIGPASARCWHTEVPGECINAAVALCEPLLIRPIVMGEDCWGNCFFFLTVISINCP